MTVIQRIFLLAALTILIPPLLRTQDRVLSTKFSFSDWGLSSPKDIRFGVLVVTHESDKDRLRTSVLLTQKQYEQRASIRTIPSEHHLPADHTIRSKSLSNATWIWNTDTLLRDPAQAQATISLIAQGNFDRTFLQVPANFIVDTSHDHGLRALVANLRRRGSTVEALVGDPHFCLPENHPIVMSLINRLINFNRNSAEPERFAGVHLDVEPYLLPGFGGPRKDWILRQYLTLTSQAAQTAQKGHLLFGTDIPFWYGLPDEFTGNVDSLEFAGVRKPINEHVTDLVDEICIMSYRTSARGANGIVSLSEGELDYAERRGKTAYVGLETSDVPDEDNVFFQGVPALNTSTLGKTDRVILMRLVGDSVYVFLAQRSVLDSLITTNHANSDSSDKVLMWEVRNTLHIPSANLSFAKLGRRQLDEVIGIVTRELSGFTSFAGVAIHHAASYAKLPE